LLLSGGAEAAGTQHVEESLSQLQSESFAGTALDGVMFPRLYDYYLVTMERIHGKYRPDSAEWRYVVTPFMVSRLALALAETAYRRGEYGQAIEKARLAVESAPNNPAANYQLARSLRAYGHPNEATYFYQKQIWLARFDMTGREELAQLYCDVARPEEAVALLDDLISTLLGSPYYADQRAKAQRLRQQAAMQARQGNGMAGLECFAAFPDWNNPAEWQEIVRLFAERYRPSDPALLMLRADPALYPNTQTLLADLQNYLLEDLRLPNHALPRITLLNQPMNSDDLWKVMFLADSCFVTPNLPPLCKELAENLHKPLLTKEGWENRE
jgi:tetratricopeptide (TPR) repeat protein